MSIDQIILSIAGAAVTLLVADIRRSVRTLTREVATLKEKAVQQRTLCRTRHPEHSGVLE